MAQSRYGILAPGQNPSAVVLERQPRAVVDILGICTLTETRVANATDVNASGAAGAHLGPNGQQVLPAIYNSYVSIIAPYNSLPNMWLKGIDLDYLANGLCRMTLTFTGFIQPVPIPRYYSRQVDFQNPIQVHPLFKTQIGGTGAAPLNGANFYNDPVTGGEVFNGFRSHLVVGDVISSGYAAIATVPGPNPLFGVTEYKTGTVLWVKEWAQASAPTPSALYTIQIPDSGSGPNAAALPTLAGTSWLLTEQEFTPEGPLWRCRQAWLRSEVNPAGITEGWDPVIYYS